MNIETFTTSLALVIGAGMLFSLVNLFWSLRTRQITAPRRVLFWFRLARTIVFNILFANFLATQFFGRSVFPPRFTGLGILFVFLIVAVEDIVSEFVDRAEYDQILRSEAIRAMRHEP